MLNGNKKSEGTFSDILKRCIFIASNVKGFDKRKEKEVFNPCIFIVVVEGSWYIVYSQSVTMESNYSDVYQGKV